jgi:hypothetical protein
MKRFLMSTCVLGGLAGCERAPDRSLTGAPAVGAEVTVLLRRDAIGVSRSPAVDPFSSESDGTKLWFRGKLVSSDQEWVCLDTQPGPNEGAPLRVWVPRETVLAIAQDPPAAK